MHSEVGKIIQVFKHYSDAILRINAKNNPHLPQISRVGSDFFRNFKTVIWIFTNSTLFMFSKFVKLSILSVYGTYRYQLLIHVYTV